MRPRTLHRRLVPHLVACACSATLAAQSPPVQFGSNFYEYVSNASITWQGAAAAAASRVFLGVPGHLVTITTAAENAFLTASFCTFTGSGGIWIGAQVDAAGTGRWKMGPESGLVFSQGQSAVSGGYANWGGIEPNNAPSYGWMNGGPAFAGIARGQWADDDDGVPSTADPVQGYVVEYESPPWQGYGTGCSGAAGVPLLAATSVPARGQQLVLAVSRMPAAGGAMVLAIGFSDTFQPGLGALPFDLAVIGAPGCNVRCDVALTVAGSNQGGAGSFTIPIPSDPSLAGLRFFQQAYVVDAAANGLGLSTSNAGRAIVQ